MNNFLLNSLNCLKTNYKKSINFFNGSFPLIKLINQSFWKNFFGPFFAFIFPLIFIVILGLILGYTSILAGSLAISPVSITLSSMPQLFFEFKNSSLLKRIGATPIKPSLFIFVGVTYYFVVVFVSIVWCILFALLIFGIKNWDVGSQAFGTTVLNPSFRTVLETVNWPGFIFGEITLLIIGLLFGMFMVSTCKSIISIQAIGISFIILSEFLCAMVLPLGSVKNISGLWYVGYVLTPFKFSTNLILESWNGNFMGYGMSGNNLSLLFEQANIFDINSSFYTTPFATSSVDVNSRVLVLDKTEKVLSLTLPFVWMIGFFVLSIKNFKWSTR